VTAPVRVDLGHNLAVVGAVPARAGGGQSSNSGSSGSSSRSSSSGSSSRSSGSSSGFGSGFGAGAGTGAAVGRSSSSGGAGSAIGGLICILLIVVVVVVLVVMFKRKGASAGGATPDTPPPPPPPPLPRSPEVDAALARIRERDPAFDEDGFLNGVATSFNLVQRAWCEQLPAESRKVMADGIWLRHRTQIDEMAAAGKKNVLEDLHIGRSEIIGCVTDADSDSITVRIHAYSRDYDVAKEGGQIVRGDRVVRLWTEDWTFTRSSSAVTKAGSGTRQNCPNCGAPLDLDAAGTCAYCKQLVMAGAYDWVLSRIEQVYSQA
jgi:predicted lipid-binding transport protein (Tim44 family)